MRERSQRPSQPELDGTAERLRRLRQKRGKSQHQVALMAGITQASLSNYERGKREVPLSTALALASALDVSLGDIVPTSDMIVLRDSRLGVAIRKLQTRPELLGPLPKKLRQVEPGAEVQEGRHSRSRRAS